jgi:hypothetical protein
MKYSRTVVVGLIISGLLIPQSAAVGSTAVNSRHKSWSAAANALGDRGTLWQPTYAAGLKLGGGVHVIAFGRTGDSKSTYSYKATSVSAGYGKRTRNFSINEKWARTMWAAKSQPDPGQRPIGVVTITMGATGDRVKASVFANCGIHDSGESTSNKKTCSERDVLRTGGYLTMQSKSTGTDLVIQSNGLTYRELLRIASGLRAVN